MNLVVLIIVQLNYVLTRSTSINSGDCHILKILLNQSRINILSSENNIVSKLNDQLLRIDDLKQAAVRNLLSTSVYSSEISETESDLTATSIDFTLINTIGTSLEVQSSEAQDTISITDSSINIQSTIITSTTTASITTTSTTTAPITATSTTTASITETSTTTASITETSTTTVSTITTATTLVEMISSSDIAATVNISDNGLFSETIDMNTTILFDTATITYSIITSDDLLTTIESPTKSEKNLKLILGLTLGLGLPICLGIIGGLVYYFKIYQPRHASIGITNTI
ncbi:unnamed protein product [Rotaria sp. Silwood2]|nr:unnamed protein product [Rotaria sp. Silwood2]CAF4272148.1 unnamed protein product [Rotaria sp. Silwood2]